MAIETELRPEINLKGVPVFVGFPSSSSSDRGFDGGRKRQRYDWEQMIYTQQLQGHQNLCSVSGFQGFVKESDRKKRNSVSGLDGSVEEIDQYIRLQTERLKWLLKQKRQQQETTLLRKIESRARSLIQQKDREITRVSNRTSELQTLLTKLEVESRAWQSLARENEATVVSLNNTIEKLKCRAEEEEEDAESCCDAGNRGVEPRSGENRVSVCKACNHGESCVLFLPCRHLCSCNSCGVVLERCPVCGTAKKTCIEALIL